MFTKVPDMKHPLEDEFASAIYRGWVSGGPTWDQLPVADREQWREKARRFGGNDISVAPWQKKVAEAAKPSIVPAWI